MSELIDYYYYRAVNDYGYILYKVNGTIEVVSEDPIGDYYEGA